MKALSSFLISSVALLLINCNNGTETNTTDELPKIAALSYSIVATLPHDTSAFTEGLEFYNNTLLESTGLNDRSKLIQTEFPSGKIVRQIKLDSQYFGEGITVLNDTVYQLTWKEHVVHVYSAKDFKKIKELKFNTQGWGLTNDGKNLIASDGTSNLYFYEPSTFKLLRIQSVTENNAPAVNINELEYINGFIYANQWQYNYILKIDPSSGEVVAKMDFTELVNKIHSKDPHAEVFNGIAYNKATNKIYITGKYWPEMYEVQFDH